MRTAFLLSLLFLLLPLSGCFGSSEDENLAQEFSYYPDINDRQFLDWEWNGSYSMVLEQGPYTPLEVQEATFEVDTSDIWETGPPTSNIADAQSGRLSEKYPTELPPCLSDASQTSVIDGAGGENWEISAGQSTAIPIHLSNVDLSSSTR